MEKSVMKRFLALLLALVMVFALCACSSTNEPKETQSGNEATSWDEIKPIKIVYAHANALSETNNKMVDNWMAAVEKASEGKISFDYHPGGSLGTYVEIIEQVESGAVNMSISDMSLFESYCPAFGVLYSPFIIDDYDHAKNIAYGKAGELLKADLAKDTNTYLLGMIMNGKRIVDTTVPIKSLDDCKGVIIRTPEAQVYTDTFKMLGMSPTAMSLTDTYTGIQTGTFALTDLCEANGHVEAMMRWVDFLYSEFGSLLIHYGPEGYAYKQQRLKLLFNAEVQKEQRNKDHHKRRPVFSYIAEQHIKACCFGKFNYFIHMSILPTVSL